MNNVDERKARTIKQSDCEDIKTAISHNYETELHIQRELNNKRTTCLGRRN
jgi:hypothetical protein